jgi:hypothetical protein
VAKAAAVRIEIEKRSGRITSAKSQGEAARRFGYVTH